MASVDTAPAPEFRYLDNVHTVKDGLQHWAGIFRSPDSEGRTLLTFSDLCQLGGRWAGTLHDRGIGRGHYVVNTLPNCPERVVADVAIMLCGAATVNGMCQLKDASDLKATLRQIRGARCPLKFVFLVCRRSETDTLATEDAGDFLNTLRRQTSRGLKHNRDVMEDDECNVFTTSGTTGFSKLVVFTHKTLVSSNKRHNRDPGVDLIDSSLGWAGGQVASTLMYGVTRVLCDDRAGVPPDMVIFVYRAIKEEGRRRRRVIHRDNASCLSSSSSDSPSVAATPHWPSPSPAVASFFVFSYGLTECLTGAMLFGTELGQRKDFQAGTTTPGVDVKIVDADGHVVEADVHGEVLLQSSVMMRGYLHDPEATRAAFTDDGFLRTGDKGWLDSEGQLYVEGRCGDAITRGAYIYPAWLEARIRDCPAVKDVMVVGVPDVTLGSELCACVILESSEMSIDDVKKFVEDDITVDTDDVQSPRPRHYLVFESFPTTDNGKVKRAEVRKMAAQRMDSVGQPSRA
ncbi:uncharacterized protein [Littorina saxatilis]|uniref:uncharacterized protein n=1 Tax=Littorina saxatilis TaxID=31220 RepID=UPI0038B5E4BB